jgi:hypothetical protein
MGLGRIGGLLVIGGWGLVVVTGLIFVTGGSVGVGALSIGGLVLAAGLALVAVGAGAIGIGGPGLLHGRAVRVGLALFAIGLIGALAASLIAGASEYDPMESIPTILLLLVGGWTSFIGAVVTVLSLLRVAGRPRRLGLVFLGGLGLCIAGGTLANGLGAVQLTGIAAALAALGGVVIVLGGIGVGVLAIDGGQAAVVADA